MRIMIADHQSKVRFALRTLLVRQPGLEVVGEADTVEDLLAGVGTTQPDLLLLHWRLGEEMSELLSTLKRVCPGLQVIVLSVRQETCHDALAAGAEAFVCKMDPPDKLLAAIKVIQARHSQDKGERHSLLGQRRCGSGRKPSAEGRSEQKGGLEILGLGGGNPEPIPQSGL
jgi:DNA-binding NarL/FixJ family response regulator